MNPFSEKILCCICKVEIPKEKVTYRFNKPICAECSDRLNFYANSQGDKPKDKKN